jgi:precorrin-6B methylase 2
VFWPDIESRIEAFIEEKTQKPWDDPRTLQKLRAAITSQKDLYWKEGDARRISYRKGYNVLAYLSYHAPVYCIQAAALLFWMARTGLVGRSVRLLDVGAGPGMVSLAASRIFPEIGVASTHISSIEQEQEHIEAYTRLMEGHGPTVNVDGPVQADILAADPVASGPFDIIVFQNVLNELKKTPEEIAGLLARYSLALAPGGSVLIVEPAERESAGRLRQVTSQAMRQGLFIHSPCPFLYGARCNPDRCWSFVTQPEIRPTRIMQALAAGEDGYRFRNTDIKFAYAVLRKERTSAIAYRVPRDSKAVRLSALGKVRERDVTVIAAVMSGELGDERYHVRKLCDGTGGTPVFAVLPRHHRSGGNTPLVSAAYGDVLALGPVKVRFNREKQAYNLLLTRGSRVAPVESPEPLLLPARRGSGPGGGKEIHTFISTGDKPLVRTQRDQQDVRCDREPHHLDT